MVWIRSFTLDDAKKIAKRYPTICLKEIEDMITEWNKKIYEDRYFEMFAVIDNDIIVGTVSLYQHTSDAISDGIEIYEEYRRKGFGLRGVELALQKATSDGYKIAVAQVLQNNTASIDLHRKLGFEIDHGYINKKGRECYFIMKAL